MPTPRPSFGARIRAVVGWLIGAPRPANAPPPRRCVDCQADIAERAHNAKRCARCAAAFRKERNRRAYHTRKRAAAVPAVEAADPALSSAELCVVCGAPIPAPRRAKAIPSVTCCAEPCGAARKRTMAADRQRRRRERDRARHEAAPSKRALKAAAPPPLKHAGEAATPPPPDDRRCIDCRVSIADRGHQAKRCVQCAKTINADRSKKRARASTLKGRRALAEAAYNEAIDNGMPHNVAMMVVEDVMAAAARGEPPRPRLYLAPEPNTRDPRIAAASERCCLDCGADTPPAAMTPEAAAARPRQCLDC